MVSLEEFLKVEETLRSNVVGGDVEILHLGVKFECLDHLLGSILS